MPYLKTLPSLTLLICLFSSSCIRKAFYYNPVQGDNFAYRSIPVGSDSMKSATYASGALSAGGMNEDWRDQVLSAQIGFHRSHAINNLRFYYGASLAYGSYRVKPYDNYYNDTYYIDTSLINHRSGSKTFGAYGINLGISASSRMGRRGEWRYIGAEGSLYNEFGDYLNFRKNLPDSAATVIEKKNYLGSLGINTELIFKGRSQHEFGIKIAMGSYLRRTQYYNGYGGNYNPYSNLFYFSNTYHFTSNRVTSYFQFNLATKAGHFQVGMNYRL